MKIMLKSLQACQKKLGKRDTCEEEFGVVQEKPFQLYEALQYRSHSMWPPSHENMGMISILLRSQSAVRRVRKLQSFIVHFILNVSNAQKYSREVVIVYETTSVSLSCLPENSCL
jgi:hypothetical protein